MRKELRFIGAFLLAGAVLLGTAPACRKGTTVDDYEWITIDESYTPQNYIEEFIKADSEEKGIFPVSIRNYGRDGSILRRFRGSQFAKPNEPALKMAYPEMDDWMLIDIKYKNVREQEIQRTVLYVQIDGQWRVGDSGRLLE